MISSWVRNLRGAIYACLLTLPFLSQAQWITQSLDLKPGWNAVFLHVDASHTTINALVASDPGNPILEIWHWNPPSTLQFIDGPQQPALAATEWNSWNRADIDPVLQRLGGNAAYLIRVGTNVTSYTWQIKGHPVTPRNDWASWGANLIAFPTANPPPKFDSFLAPSPELLQSAEIYQYPGGELGPNNPLRVPSLLFRGTSVKRGQAFWIRSGTVFNRYFGPFEVALSGANAVDFRDSLNTYSLRLRNLTASNLVVTLKLAPSEAPVPAGQANIVGVPSLLLRGNLNSTNFSYSYTNLPINTARTWTLAGAGLSGSEIEVVLGINRSAMTGNVGDLFAGILQFSDSLGHLRIDIPTSAAVASGAGLWVGGASVTQVGHYLKSYARDVANELITGPNGQYIPVATNSSLGSVARSFPLRLIIHNPDAAGNALLLQRVYHGLDGATNPVVANSEAALNRNLLGQARRISAAHLPWTQANTPWAFNGKLGQATDLTAIVTLGYNDQASNPFVHTYHPDHDNLDSTFRNVLAQGSESYSAERVITLHVSPPANDFAAITAGGRTLTGNYEETITLKGLARAGGQFDTRQFEVRGVFTLNHISDIPTLTTVP